MEERQWFYQTPLEDLIELRNTYDVGTGDWHKSNESVAGWLEGRYPFMNQYLMCISGEDVEGLKDGFSEQEPNFLSSLTTVQVKHSLLYQQSLFRSIEVYAVIRYMDTYYFAKPFALSDNCVQLVHTPVSMEYQDDLNLSKSCLNAIRQLLRDQLSIGDSKVDSIRHLGILKGCDDKKQNVFGVVYELTLSDDQFQWDGAASFQGHWMHECDMVYGNPLFDSWTAQVMHFVSKS